MAHITSAMLPDAHLNAGRGHWQLDSLVTLAPAEGAVELDAEDLRSEPDEELRELQVKLEKRH